METKKTVVQNLEELTERLGGESALKEAWNEALKMIGIADNTIEFQWSRNDSIPPDVVARVVSDLSKNRAGSADAQEQMKMAVYEDLMENVAMYEMFQDDEDYIMGKFTEVLAKRGIEVTDLFPWGDFLFDIKDRGWLEEDPNVAQLMEQTRLKCNVTLATPEELNFDSVACGVGEAVFGNEDFNPDWNDEERDYWVNGISWLVRQQGYELSDLFDAEKASGSPFLASMREELNNLTGGCPYLTVLAQIDALKLGEMTTRDGRNVEFPKDIILGLYSHTDGSGAPLGIELERPLVVPKELMFNISIEGAGHRYQIGYTVDETYGLVGEAWKPGVSMTDAAAPSIEDVRRSISLPELQSCVETALRNAEAEREARTADLGI